MTTINEQLKQAAANAGLTSRAMQLLQNFFLKLATQAEKDELDTWLNESEANSYLFDLLLEVNRDGTGASVLSTLMRFQKKEPPKVSRFATFMRRAVWVLLALLVADHWLPGHPLSKLLQVESNSKPYPKDITVSTEEQSRVIWLSDSTRVELLPHSTITYPEEFYMNLRLVEVKGNARFDVRKSEQGYFRVHADQLSMRTLHGAFELQQEKEGKRVVVDASRGDIIFGIDSKNAWVVSAGEKGVYAGGKFELERPAP